MGLETGTGIGDLVPTNPLSTDAVSSGDDHLRLIKTVMQSITFFKSVQTFTASGTWTRPANVKKVIIYCLGGGAGGSGGQAAGYSGGGGSGGGTGIKWLDVSAISSATVTIGGGGAAGAAAAAGSDGTDTSFVTAGSVTQCLGIKGLSGGSPQYFGGVASLLTNNVGDIKFAGGDGQSGSPPIVGATLLGSLGGGSGGARGGQASQANSGGGGGGGSCDGTNGNPGGTGGSGYCIVLEFGW